MKCDGSYEYDGKTFECNHECGCGWFGCPLGGTGLAGAIEDVTDFHDAMGQPAHRELHTPSDERVKLRADLIFEECAEFMESVFDGFEVYSYDDYETHVRWGKGVKVDHVGVADALADLIYVCIGAANELGIDLNAVWKEVHRSNMAKIGPNGEVKRREDGKVIKPDGWTPPNIKKVLGIK